mmetsp:Transcript_30029/g.55259  ORF Transcript_30029/g.55259 Transcript_30029/m.55259 type:complete len:139 (+) Transcript_30029:100-516(+)
MKSSTVTVTLATLFAASAKAAKLTRRRTQTQHKSLDERYLGLEQNERVLDGHGDHGSMPLKEDESHDSHDDGHDHGNLSMSHPMSMPDDAEPTTLPEPEPETSVEVKEDDGSEEDGSGAMSIGTIVSALASAGAMMLF